MAEAASDAHGEHHVESPYRSSGWRRWLFTTDHKEIGAMYLWLAFFFFVVGGILAILMRLELASPGRDLLSQQAYNEFFTMHGTTMIFLWTMPVFAGFGNYLVPLMIGAKDMAFPRINAISFWLLFIGGALLFVGVLNPTIGQGAAGWTGYAPLSAGAGADAAVKRLGMDTWILGLHILGVASTLGALNFVVTILKMRAPGVTFHNMPLMVWAQFTTALLLVFATPTLTAALTFLWMDRNLGTRFFAPEVAGPVLWQNLFWFFGHPEVYILILPAMGIVSEVIPKFSGRPIFGYKAMAYSILAIGFLGFTVWAHHMFVTGIDVRARIVFMINTMIIGVPTGIKMFNWLATMWGGRIQFRAPMLFAIGFLSMFLIGGIDGVFLASIPVDYALSETYWVVSHIHYVLFGGAVMGAFAGLYYWFPRMTGRMYNERVAVLHFLFTLIAMNMVFMVMHNLGVEGMPRRYYDYLPEFAAGNLLATAGAVLLGASQLLFFGNILWSLRNGPVVAGDPWGGEVRPEWRNWRPRPSAPGVPAAAVGALSATPLPPERDR
ncbi:MAG TPA: cytochrome c oxidase subunit I [Candidatus Thermoplasmatota archaeon]|nr:cytochrome c oxidase subunit I [Candidatus Thermoplasmatota archaeon]